MKRAALVATVALAALPARAQGPAPADRPTLTVRGSATVEQKPDTAEITVSVVTRGPTPGATAQAHRDRIARAKALLDRARDGGATVEARSFSLVEERPPAAPGAAPPAAPPTFRAETRYAVTTRALDGVDALAAGLASSGVFELAGLRFSVADPGAATDRARRAAVADARHQAEVYADAAGMRLDGVDRIADGDATGADGAYDLPVRAARAASVGISPPASLSFAGSVTMVWRLAPR